MARNNKILDSGMSQNEIMAEWDAGGERRDALTRKLGFASSNGLYNALRAMGYIAGGPVSGGDGGKRSNSGKIKGCLPIKVQARIAKELGLDMEEDEIGWTEWVRVSNEDETFEGLTMSRLAGGEESEGGKSYRQWIETNRANDRAIADAAARAADPTIQLKDKLAKANRLLDERECEIDELKTRIETLEVELAAEKSRPATRGPRMGGELTQDMLRIMKQRFHPDKNNGSPELCTAVMQWLNAIEL